MTNMGILDRMIRSSVDRALRMQPKRSQKVADEYLYTSPAARPDVEEIRNASARLVSSGLTTSSLGRVVVRRSDKSVTQVVPGKDLTAVDARHLETVDVNDGDIVVLAAASTGAAVLAHPVSLLALSLTGRTPERSVGALSELAGPIEIAGVLPSYGEGVWIVPSLGVVSVASDVGAAVTRLEAAERLAAITVLTREQ